ncbi:MAG TPA: MerR family transcriptional regulator [Clostridiales bacterium]|nr:MerR family transcriptional regulator [Clostridiales bacterium]
MKDNNKMNPRFLSTGEIYKRYQISLKTLRYYDEIGLLSPKNRDGKNGYRYYSWDEIAKLMAIKYYQEAGVPLEKIKDFFFSQSLVEIIPLFEDIITEKEKEIRNMQIAMDNLIAWKNLVIEGERLRHKKNSSFEIKKMRKINTLCEPCTFVDGVLNSTGSLRTKCLETKQPLYGATYMEFNDFQRFGIGGSQLCFCHMEINPLCFYSIDYSELGDCTVASTIHLGSTDKIWKSYSRLIEWTGKQGLTLKGNAIERYIIDVQTIDDPNCFVTEIMLPLKEES